MSIKSILNLPSPEIEPNIENATVVRDAVISAFANGVSGTTDEIPQINFDSESSSPRRTRVASLLGYTSSTAQHAKLFLNTLIAPREFNLVDARLLGLPVIEESERSNVLLSEEKTHGGTLSAFTFPCELTSPYIEPFARSMDIFENGVPDVKTEIIMFRSDTQGIMNQSVARYFYKNFGQDYPVGDVDRMTSVLKANAEGDFNARPVESTALRPEKTGLLSFWVFPKRMNPEELKQGAFGSPWGREMLYVKKAEKIGGFDVVTMAYNRKRIVDDLRKELSNAQRDQKDGSVGVVGAWLNLLDNSGPDPEFQMVGIGRIKIDGEDYYVYTGADKGGIKVPKPGQAYLLFHQSRHRWLEYL